MTYLLCNWASSFDWTFEIINILLTPAGGQFFSEWGFMGELCITGREEGVQTCVIIYNNTHRQTFLLLVLQYYYWRLLLSRSPTCANYQSCGLSPVVLIDVIFFHSSERTMTKHKLYLPGRNYTGSKLKWLSELKMNLSFKTLISRMMSKYTILYLLPA